MKRIFWDHLPFWFIVALALGVMVLDISAQINERGIYAPRQEQPS